MSPVNKIVIPFEGYCPACRAVLKVGETAYHVRGLGLHHFDCLSEADREEAEKESEKK